MEFHPLCHIIRLKITVVVLVVAESDVEKNWLQVMRRISESLRHVETKTWCGRSDG